MQYIYRGLACLILINIKRDTLTIYYTHLYKSTFISHKSLIFIKIKFIYLFNTTKKPISMYECIQIPICFNIK